MSAPLNGWVRFPRALLAESWYTDLPPLARALYLHLVMAANFAPSVTRKGVALGPGMVVTSWAQLADAMSGIENSRRVKPTLWKVRATAALLEKAGTIAWTTAAPTAGGGLVVTLTRWALHAEPDGTTADPNADTTADPLRNAPQHSENKAYPPAGGQAEKPHRRVMADFLRRSRESMKELHEVRARERGETVQ
jgi:hypothetical protein